MNADVVRVAVIGDSTAFTDATGPLPPDAPGLWPNVMAREVTAGTGRTVAVTVCARPGVDTLAAWLTLTKDRHVMFDVVGPADVVVVAIGSFDHAPAGLPPVLDTIVPHLRPAGLRRRFRRAVRALHPRIVRLRRARGVRTPPAEFARRYGRVLEQARGLTMHHAVCVALGPTSHRSEHHGGQHPRRQESEARQLALAAAHGYATVGVWELVEPFADRLNVDGVHWPTAAHAAVGRAVASVVAGALEERGREPSAAPH